MNKDGTEEQKEWRKKERKVEGGEMQRERYRHDAEQKEQGITPVGLEVLV